MRLSWNRSWVNFMLRGTKVEQGMPLQTNDGDIFTYYFNSSGGYYHQVGFSLDHLWDVCRPAHEVVCLYAFAPQYISLSQGNKLDELVLWIGYSLNYMTTFRIRIYTPLKL